MKKIYIWGIGKYGSLLCDSLKSNLCVVIGAVDSDERKQRERWRGKIDVLSPTCLKSAVYDYVVIAVANYMPVLSRCQELEILPEKILVLNRDWENIDFIDYKLKEIFKLKKKILELESEVEYLKWKNDIRWENAPYEFGVYKTPVIKSSEDLLKKIIREHRSLCRFGDGELELMRGKARPWFQDVNIQLSERLKEIFYSEKEEVLIAVSNNFGNLDCYTQNAADEIRAYLSNSNTRNEVMELLGTEREYFDAYVSRPYLMYRDKGHAERIFALLKTLWSKRNILLVEGEYVRTGVGNDLFQNAASLRRILCPYANAFDQYEEILKRIKENVKSGDLLLLCLGPTATVLAYDICLYGIQAIDLGQIDNEYEWFLKGAMKREAIEGKAVPELEGSHESDESGDREYRKQIIARI